MVEIKVDVDSSGFEKIIKSIPEFNKVINDTAYNFVKRARDSIAIQLISQTKMAPRDRMASTISYAKSGENRYVVTLPIDAHDLDTRKPTKLIIGRNQKLRDWVQKFYIPMFIKTGQSRVYKDNQGNILPGSFIMATSDPFVNTGFLNVYPQLGEMLNLDTNDMLNRVLNLS